MALSKMIYLKEEQALVRTGDWKLFLIKWFVNSQRIQGLNWYEAL